MTLLKSNPRTNSTFETRNCTFIDNERAGVAMEGGVWRDFGSSFMNSKESEIQLSSRAIAIASSSMLQGNSDTNSGGAMHLVSESYFVCHGCVFENNSARYWGGVVFAEQDSSVRLTNCVFRNNSAVEGGGVLYFTSCQFVVSYVDSSLIENNVGGNFGVVFLQTSVLHMNNVTMRSNSGGACAGITLLMATINIDKSHFSSMSGENAAFLAMYTNGVAIITNSVFEHGQCKDGGILYLSSNSNLTLSASSFHHMITRSGGVVSAFASSELWLSEVEITDAISLNSGSLLSVSESSVFISKSRFRNYAQGGVFGNKLPKIEIVDSEFTSGEGLLGASLYMYQSIEVTIRQCTFSEQKASQGAALNFESLENRQLGSVSIDNCVFTNNSATSLGGAIFAINHKVDISGGLFVNNTAEKGGAVAFECTILAMCNYSVHEAVFKENKAKVSGGAISWTGFKPVLTALTFENNIAQYGDDIASYPIYLKIERIASKSPSRQLTESSVRDTLAGVAPGQVVNSVIVASLRDHYGQVHTIDNSSMGSVESSQAEVSGVFRVAAKKGLYVFDSFIVYAKPESVASLSVITNAIPANGEGDPDPHTPSVLLTTEIRNCVPGEYRSEKSCSVCAYGTYSLEPDTPCLTCPSNAQCLGNRTVIPNSGYWRSSESSPVIRECPNKASCLGGGNIDSGETLSLKGRCATGFIGNLCQSCADGFSRAAKNKCDKCPERNINIVKLILIAIVMLIVIVIMVLSTLRAATRIKATHSIMIRIFVNYLQLTLLVTDFKLSWPRPVLELFDVQESAGGVTEQAYSVDCFLTDEKADPNIYYRKMMIMAGLPIPLVIASVAFWLIVAGRKRNMGLMKRECVATIIILFFLILPNLVKAFFSMFSCTEIEAGELWLTIDMNIRCWDSTHTFNVLVIALPAIIVWIFGFPLACLGVLTKFKARQDELWMKLQYGFLINGYRRRCFYWEFVILYRKITIICVSVLMNNSIPIQALTVQFVLAVAFFLQYKIRPYTTVQLNALETWAIVVADVTIYCGLYYLTGDLSESTSWFLFILICLANLVFMVYWIAGLLGYFIDVVSFQYLWAGRILKPGQYVDREMQEFIDSYGESGTGAEALAKFSLRDIHRRIIGQQVEIYSPRKCAYSPRSLRMIETSLVSET